MCVCRCLLEKKEHFVAFGESLVGFHFFSFGGVSDGVSLYNMSLHSNNSHINNNRKFETKIVVKNIVAVFILN